VYYPFIDSYRLFAVVEVQVGKLLRQVECGVEVRIEFGSATVDSAAGVLSLGWALLRRALRLHQR
jgi:hypothetical protein